MTDTNPHLPPPANPVEKQWEVFLNQNPAVTSELMKFRYGYLARTPLESSRNLMNTQYYGVATPHPQQKGYSAIETARKNREEAIQRERQRRVTIHGVSQVPPWIPPDQHPDLLRFRPRLARFEKSFVRFRLPKY
jgi:hypothetical protein